MAAEVIGKVKSGKGKTYEVKWNKTSKETYVSYAGWTLIGRLPTPSSALIQAEHWLINK